MQRNVELCSYDLCWKNTSFKSLTFDIIGNECRVSVFDNTIRHGNCACVAVFHVNAVSLSARCYSLRALILNYIARLPHFHIIFTKLCPTFSLQNNV